MKRVLVDIHARASELQAIVAELIAASKGIPTTDPNLTSSGGLTFSEIVARADGIASVGLALGGQPEDKFILASFARMVGFRDAMLNLRGAIERFISQIRNVSSWGGFERIDGNGSIFAKDGNNVGARGHLDEIQSVEDSTVEHYLFLASVTQPKAIGTFGAASKVLNEQAQKAGSILNNLEERLGEITQRTAAIAAQEEEVRQAEAEARRLVDEVEKNRKTVEENQSKAASATAMVDEIRQQAGALEAQVREYQSQFEAFQKSLKSREDQLAKGNKDLEELTASLEAERAAITKLKEQAEQMLGGATVAGLSSEYKNRADAVDKQLKWARWGYYASVVFLVVSVLVALNLVRLRGSAGLPPLPAFDPNASAGGAAVQILASLGSRALVILPSLLLAGFAAHRHSALFRLREEYSHKSAIAASVHGFKLQAPGFQEPIAAAVFQELLVNPATTMDAKRSKAANGFLARLITPQVEAALERLRQIPTTASGGIGG